MGKAVATPAAPPPATLRLKEAARHINMSASWLHQATQRGEVPVVRLGRAVRYRVEDLDQFLVERTENQARESGA